ncbi:AbrB/MazE/SpoVT family DNA-binding domain-containing protein [Bartonella bilalgolemii]|uniref:Antitoxin n=1 Tax=Bartonella bilalgolemii TaxID=2942911 RepID=A0ABT0PB13_9HYPH|nr:antitoxin [Bartonella sp. G70]MCL6230033.1 antitoxin [Bartonella sp. G70]
MYTTKLRKVGGSVMLSIPPALLDVLHLTENTEVGLAIDNGRLVVGSPAQPRYTMAELLAASDYSQPQSPEEREWVDASAVGGELI